MDSTSFKIIEYATLRFIWKNDSVEDIMAENAEDYIYSITNGMKMWCYLIFNFCDTVNTNCNILIDRNWIL